VVVGNGLSGWVAETVVDIVAVEEPGIVVEEAGIVVEGADTVVVVVGIEAVGSSELEAPAVVLTSAATFSPFLLHPCVFEVLPRGSNLSFENQNQLVVE